MYRLSKELIIYDKIKRKSSRRDLEEPNETDVKFTYTVRNNRFFESSYHPVDTRSTVQCDY